jgi:exodeoxyribonuclease V alpha subunit
MVVVDEVSMIDLSLMTCLVDALAARTGLVLLGDKNQLSSVEAGSVLADICFAFGVNRFSEKLTERVNRFIRCEERKIRIADEEDTDGFVDTVVHLERSFRFKSSAGIGKVSRKIVENASVASILEDMESEDKACVFQSYSEDGIAGILEQEGVADRLAPFLKAGEPEEALEKLSGFIILTPLGAGPWGVHEINRQTEAMLAQKGFADTAAEFYDHRPVLILENDYSLDLFNGDTGVILTDETGSTRAFFKGPDGLRQFIPGLLPAHQTAFAMTVHKSQGSEFTDVLFVIPNRYSPVMTRELVYTAVTRARNSVTIRGDRDVLAQALDRRTVRSSGLARQIRRYSVSSDR